MSFSTFELPIKKLLKLIIIVGGIGFFVGIGTSVLVGWQTNIFKPDALHILGNAIWVFHATYPAMFAIYALFVTSISVILWLNNKHEKEEKRKRNQYILEDMKNY